MKTVETMPATPTRPTPGPTRPTRRPSTSWYWLAAIIAVVGLVGAAVWGVAAVRDYQQRIDSLTRMTVPGQMTVQLTSTGGRVLYYEGSGSPSLSELGVQVTDPQGASIQVHRYAGDLRYDAPDGSVGHAVGTFEATTAGTYGVTVSGTTTRGDQVAVGDSLVAKTVASALTVVLLPGVAVVGSLMLAVVTFARRSRAARL